MLEQYWCMSWTFFFIISMEKILQSLVKIIIIGSLYETTNVNCNRQFSSPPIPYFQNPNYFIPSFVPPYVERVPVYYQEPTNIPPPISYQNLNSYTPPQLFHQNENYNPSQFTNPAVSYSVPQVFPFKPNIYPAYKPEEKLKFEFSQGNFKKPLTLHAGSHMEGSQKKPAFYATNIIVKEESHPPYYHDEYSKNYQDEDYTDNYSDDSSSQSDPCLLNSPYRYFESPKPALNSPNFDNKYVLCNPHFQPNSVNGVYTLKMPITLLPSRFPPRVEEFIERIQNYFSTYTHQETPKPQNQTLVSTTIMPTTEASSESEIYSTTTTEDYNKKNTTVENEDVNLEQNNSEPSESFTVSVMKEVTEKTTAPIEDVKISLTTSPDAQIKKENQMFIQNTSSLDKDAKNSSVTTEVFSNHQEELQTTVQYSAADLQAEVAQTTVSSLMYDNQTVKESSHPANNTSVNLNGDTQMTNVENWRNTSDSAEIRNKLEETNTNNLIEETLQLQVTDNNG